MRVGLLNFFDLRPLNTSKRALNTIPTFFGDTHAGQLPIHLWLVGNILTSNQVASWVFLTNFAFFTKLTSYLTCVCFIFQARRLMADTEDKGKIQKINFTSMIYGLAVWMMGWIMELTPVNFLKSCVSI